MILEKFGYYGLAFFGIILTRYFLIAGGTFWLFYSVLGKKTFSGATSFISAQRRKAIQKEIELSVSSTVFFAIGAAGILSVYDTGGTKLYADIHQYGWWYLGFSFIAVLILQDAYFYFTHRLCHHPWLFKWLHQGHHCSKEPTPWTSFAFDPAEAIIQALFFVGIVFLIPLHFVTLIAVLITMTIWAVLTHLGCRLLPSSSPYGWIGRGLVGPSHHAIHHRKYTMHYGLYFTFWDNVFNTQDPKYQENLAEDAVQQT